MYEHVKENKVGKIFNFSFIIKAKKDPVDIAYKLCYLLTHLMRS